MRFIVCHIGAREHYAIARSLHRAGQLDVLVTDVSYSKANPLSRFLGVLSAKFRSRQHPELVDATIAHFTWANLGRKLVDLVYGRRDVWNQLISQNRYFQARAVDYLRRGGWLDAKCDRVVIVYSYAAYDILLAAKSAGIKTVLCQIDGGQADEQLIARLLGAKSANRAPESYWQSWREECRLADSIMVNSDWSKQLLVKAGIPVTKIITVPVVYDGPRSNVQCRHHYPDAFDEDNPLLVLYVGALTARKGVMELLEAAKEMLGRPVKFTLVGGHDSNYSDALWQVPNVTRILPVPRIKVVDYYKQAHVLVFPTHSDGFGMVQVEALANGLPVIASRNCAQLIKHGHNGLLLNEVTASTIINAINTCLQSPATLAEMSVTALQSAKAHAEESEAILFRALENFAVKAGQ